jgi:hypothetical protein
MGEDPAQSDCGFIPRRLGFFDCCEGAETINQVVGPDLFSPLAAVPLDSSHSALGTLVCIGISRILGGRGFPKISEIVLVPDTVPVIYLLRRPSAEGIEERGTMFLIHLPLNHYGPNHKKTPVRRS